MRSGLHRLYAEYTQILDRVGASALGCAAALMLAACDVQAPVASDSPIPFRNPTAPIGATTRFDATRFAGDWHVVASFGAPQTAAPTFSLEGATADLVVQDRSCVACPPDAYEVEAPGVLRPVAGGEPLVVMWVDADFRTAALGTASGSHGAILDRRAGGSQDRVKAARQILEFYGWDLSRLGETP